MRRLLPAALLIAAALLLRALPAAAQITPAPGGGGLSGTSTGIVSFAYAARGVPATLTISTATFTPSFDAANNFGLTLVHASCPCTLANPSTTPVAGQSGVFVITQSATGSDMIGTFGSDYVTPGGTASITLSTGAGVSDYLPYYVADATHIVLGSVVQGPTH
jgi:hypothetical protein